jgi:hypothetical protein
MISGTWSLLQISVNKIRKKNTIEGVTVASVAINSDMNGGDILDDKSKKKFRSFSPQANYTDRATAACGRS